MPVVHFVTKDELGLAEIDPFSTSITILHDKLFDTVCFRFKEQDIIISIH